MSFKWIPCVGTMSWCSGTNAILASKHDIAKGQTRALWDGYVDSSQLFCLLLRLKVFRSIALKYVCDSNTEYSDAAF